MELYTLDDQFLLKDTIEEFSSVIWTERYSTPGDITLTVPATVENIAKLSVGAKVALVGSKEVMLIDTQDIDGDVLKVTGSDLLLFLNQRVFHESSSELTTGVYQIFYPVGTTVGKIVQFAVIDCGIDAVGDDYSLTGGYANQIHNFDLDLIDDTGDAISYTFAFGPLWDAIKEPIANDNLGVSMYLSYATETDYRLKFTLYRGRDLTSDQTDNPLVRFSPELDSLINVKEVRSNIGYKNVAYAFATAITDGSMPNPAVAYADTAATTATGFDRRVMFVSATEVTPEILAEDPTRASDMLAAAAKNALANNNFTKALDGEVVPQADFQYGVHYGMGDVVELAGYSGLTQKARITEYIRTQDSTGERAYPTVTVID